MADPVDVLRGLTATLKGRDVLQLASKIIVAEDMNSTFPRCMVEIGKDSRYEMQEALAGEDMMISIQPQNGPALQCKYKVHSAKPSLNEDGKGLSGHVFGVDEDYGKCIAERVTTSFDKKNTDDAIKEIHQKHIGSSKKIEVTQGFKQASFTVPTQMPLKAIEKCGDLSGIGSKGFYFNTHRDGGTSNFKTMKDMASKGPKRQFVYNGAGSADMNTVGDPSTIFDLHYQGSSISNQKQTKAQGQRFNPQFGKFANNDKSSAGLSVPGLGVKDVEAKVGRPIVNSPEQDKEKRLIDSDQQNLNEYSSKLKILVPIATDLHVGDVIQVNSGSATYFSDASPNNAASGKWLIVSLMHIIDPGGREESPGHTGRTLLHCIGKIS